MNLIKFESFKSIRGEYIKYGTPDEYYKRNSDDYINPHVNIIVLKQIN